jgi:two-component system sensor histidine kinase MprB
MRLQTRLALLFGMVVTISCVVMGALSYATIAARLTAQTDATLLEAAVPLAGELRTGREPHIDDDHGRPGGENGLLLPATLLTPDGRQVPASTSTVTLPVDHVDWEIAAAAKAATRFQDVTIDGRPYRMVTQGAGAGRGAALVGRDWSENAAVLKMLALFLIGLGLAVAALAGVAGWFLARRSARNLVELTDAAEMVAQTGNLDADVAVVGTDEIARMAAAFNKMLLRLAAAQADQARLVQDAGHELRTPLTSLRTNVSLLRRFDEMPPDTRARVIADLDGETRELTRLVNEIVALAAAEPAERPASLVPLADVAASVVARARRRTGREVTLSADHCVVLGRSGAIERAMWNLCDNAAKFSPAGSPIEMSVAAGVVTVSDRGPGIEPEDVPHVFERFYRATAARSRPGSGLGLAIVRDVARSGGGDAFARNRPGGGAQVGFWLPVTDNPDQGLPAHRATGVGPSGPAVPDRPHPA